jgi:hypothetical protein
MLLDHSDLTVLAAHQYSLVSGEALAPNAAYYWRVRSFNSAGGYGQWSVVWSLRTAVTPPVLSAPANAAALNYNRPNFLWNSVPGATGYVFQVAKDAGFTQMVTNTSVTPSTYTPTSNLPAKLMLYWRVQAKAANGPSAWSAVWSLVTANPPSVPSLVSPGNGALITNYTPTLAWSLVTLPSGTSFGHYELQISTSSTFASMLLDHSDLTVLAAHQYSLVSGEALAPNAAYYWRVRSFNSAGGYGQWSVVWSLRTAVTPPVLSAPDDAATTTNRRPTFDWDDVSGASSYYLQVSTNGTFTSLMVNVTVSASTYTPTANLHRGTLYWRVRANGTNGPSSWSVIRSLVEQ